MTTPAPIRVWAPRAHEVAIDWQGADGTSGRAVMTAEPDGWWASTPAPATAYPLDYSFRIDDGTPLPDPRAAWLPGGVHGPARTFDAAEFRWHDSGWRGPQAGAGTLGGVIYELHVGTFTPEGTLDAALGHLDHLVALGVDVVELLPVAAFPGRWGWGYDGVGLYAVHDGYGGPAALQRFVDACHDRGLGVCLDVVYNHLGPSGNYLASFGPYFTDQHVTPWGSAVNLDDDGSEQVRRFVVDAVLRWFRDFHLDALRLDAVHELRDASDTHVLAEIADATRDLERELGRPLTLIAESDLNDDIMVTPTEEGGRGMDAQWADDVHHALHTALTGESQGYYADFAEPGVLAKTLAEVFLHDGRESTFRGQDWGKPVDRAKVGGRRFVAYLQTHDQVGNRATGDRVDALLTPGQHAAGATLYLLGPFTPMVFMGEEWAAGTAWQFFTDFPEPELAQAVRTGRRAEFSSHGWDEDAVPDPQSHTTRDASVLAWSELDEPEHARMLRWYVGLISLRHHEPALRDDDLQAVVVREGGEDTPTATGGWLVMERDDFRVVANLGAEPATIPLVAADATADEIDSGTTQDAHVVLAWEPSATRVEGGAAGRAGGGLVLTMPGRSAAVVRLGPSRS